MRFQNTTCTCQILPKLVSFGCLLIFILTTGCLGPVRDLYPKQKQQRPVPVYVVSHGWHVGLAFESNYLKRKLPEHKELPEGKFLLVSWGDNKYFPSERARIDLFLRAAFLPTGSVIHLVGTDKTVDNYFQNSDIIRVQISKKGMEKVTDYLADRFEYDAKGELKFSADGLYRNSAFFKAKGLYFFPKTSNKWTARLLRKSGFPITPFYAITSGNVIRQARKSGEVIQRR